MYLVMDYTLIIILVSYYSVTMLPWLSRVGNKTLNLGHIPIASKWDQYYFGHCKSVTIAASSCGVFEIVSAVVTFTSPLEDCHTIICLLGSVQLCMFLPVIAVPLPDTVVQLNYTVMWICETVMQSHETVVPLPVIVVQLSHIPTVFVAVCSSFAMVVGHPLDL